MDGSERSVEKVRSASGSRRRFRNLMLAGIGLLYLVSVPWYRQDSELRLVLGLPDWVTFSLACYGLVALLNCLAWLSTDVDDDGPLAPVFAERDESGEHLS